MRLSCDIRRFIRFQSTLFSIPNSSRFLIDFLPASENTTFTSASVRLVCLGLSLGSGCHYILWFDGDCFEAFLSRLHPPVLFFCLTCVCLRRSFFHIQFYRFCFSSSFFSLPILSFHIVPTLRSLYIMEFFLS